MNAAPRPPRHRLALRIYLVSAAALGAALLAFYLLASAVWPRPAHRGPLHELSRYAAAEIAERWESEAAVAGALSTLRATTRLAASAYRWDGTLVASAAPQPPAPLTALERDELLRTGVLERGGDCGPDHACLMAVRLPGGAAPRGYLVLETLRPPRGPPPFLEIAVAVLLAGLAAGALLLGRSLARPLDRLARTAQALGAGDLRARTGIVRRDELGTVARSFDEMADRVEKLLRSQTELVANVAHELRTPLARIRVALDLADAGDAAVARESLAEIAEDLGELEALVDDVLAAARIDLADGTVRTGAPTLHVTALDVSELARGAAERLRHRHPGRTVEVAAEPGLPPVEGDAVLLRRALDNLLDNARKYSPPDAPIHVRVARHGPGVVL
ncbi:MAG TPA: HAMP domain-containing sensor histidine kinase, partial [Anaeromyxobacteraceae bacterium]|nr:HAMP domain-containing sensor histidine kinase [Anaeromyxobacteraceae bacterium]